MSLELVEWALTYSCNLSCRHCHVQRAGKHGEELDPDEALALADRLAHAGCRSITLSGGEPLLRPDWADIAGQLAERGVFTQVVSNASLLTIEQARRARDAGVDAFLLSLDGVGAAHDWVRRRPGSYREVMAACDQLDAVGVRFGFVTTLLVRNSDQLEPLAELVRERGATVWQVWLGMPPKGAVRSNRLWMGRRDVASLRKRMAKLQQRCASLVLGDNLREEHACPAGSRVLGISGDGQVRGCLALDEEHSVGSVRDHALEDLRHVVVRNLGLACQGCRATNLGPQVARPRTMIGAAAATLLLASGLASGCSSTSNPPESALQESTPATGVEAQAAPPADVPIMSPSEMPPCCLSHMLIPDCVCSWKGAKSDALKMKLQIPSTGEPRDVPGGIEINCRTGQTGLTPGRLTIVADPGPAPVARPADITLKNGAVLHATGTEPQAAPGQQAEQTRTGILTLGNDRFTVTCWTESGVVVGKPALWPNWCAHSLGTIEKHP